MRILLIEDDTVLAERIKSGLEKNHFRVDVAPDGVRGLALALEDVYSLIILDLMLPGRDGWSVCQTVRKERAGVPVLILTARDSIEDRVHGLELGADDYLAKPFDFRELLARVRALLRREHVHRSQVMRIADLEIDRHNRTVRRAGQAVSLTPHEYSLLEALAGNEGRTLSREYILERVWGDEDSYSNTVSYHVATLRKKIDAGPGARLIQTVHGVGYVLRRPEESES